MPDFVKLLGKGIIVSDKERVNRKMQALFDTSPGNIKLLTDFDQTFTKGPEGSSWFWLRNTKEIASIWDYLNEYSEEANGLYVRYKDIEHAPSLTTRAKNKALKTWLHSQLELLRKFNFNKAILGKLIFFEKNKIRSGFDELMSICKILDIQVLILSGGLGNLIEEFLKKYSLLSPNIEIAANFLRFDRKGVIREIEYDKLIYSHDKNIGNIKHTKFYKKITDRTFFIQIGDRIEDVNVMKDFPSSNVLSIGILDNEKTHNKDMLSSYLDHYDILILDDESIAPLNRILSGFIAHKNEFIEKKRFFNTFEYDYFSSIIEKSSSNKDKIRSEFDWFRSVPDDIRIFAPRVYDLQSQAGSASYKMEFYGYGDLATQYLDAGEKDWNSIIKKIIALTDHFKKYKSDVDIGDYYQMYVEKLYERLDALHDSSLFWSSLLESKEVTINGKSYRNIPSFLGDKEKFKKVVRGFFSERDNALVHGDLCLSNILYEPENQILRLIDPRGSWGNHVCFGDVKYDLAKLRHSFCSYYDFLIDNRFSLDLSGDNEISFKVKKRPEHEQVARSFDRIIAGQGINLHVIRFIESTLFLSMISLHKDSFKRQLAMYATGIQLLNDSYEKIS